MPPLGPDIIRRQVVIGASAVSPDGERVVYTRRTVAGDRYQVNLWLVPYRGGRPRRLTHGKWSDSAPAWSPDGRTIAFLSDRGAAGKPDDDAGAELYLIDPDGGEAERVCEAPHGGVGAPLWSPDGRAIAFVSSGDEVRFWTGDPKKHVARVIRTTDWQDDGGTSDRRSHLFVVAARAGARPAPGDEGRLRRLAAVVAPVRQADRVHVEPRARRRPPPQDPHLRGGRARREAQGAGRARRAIAEQPVWSPDGRKLAFVGTDIPGAPDYAEPTLWVREGSDVRSLTAHLDIPTTRRVGLRPARLARSPIDPVPHWDGDDVLSIVNRLGRDEVWRAPLRGEPRACDDGRYDAVGALGRRRPHRRHGDRRPEPTRGVRRRGRHGCGRSRATADRGFGEAPPRSCARSTPAASRPSSSSRPAPASERRWCSRRTAARTARTRRRPSSTRGCSSRAATASWLPTSAGRAATGAPGSRRSRATGAAPTPTIS